jgi:hypothetical protein
MILTSRAQTRGSLSGGRIGSKNPSTPIVDLSFDITSPQTTKEPVDMQSALPIFREIAGSITSATDAKDLLALL